MPRFWLMFALFAASNVVLLFATEASAQAAPDVVILRDGGMLRGWILESLPDERVTIRLVDGRAREVAWSEVSYAGPESDRPRTSAPTEQIRVDDASAPPPPVEVQVRVQSADSNLTLYRRGESRLSAWYLGRRFDRLCSVPCELSLPLGPLELALAQGSGDLRSTRTIDITRAGTLDVHYVDRLAIRVVGWILFSLTIAAATTVAVGFAVADDAYASVLGALGTLGGGFAISLPMAALQDVAEARFR